MKLTDRQRSKLVTVWRGLGAWLHAPAGKKPARVAAQRVERTPRRIEQIVHRVLSVV